MSDVEVMEVQEDPKVEAPVEAPEPELEAEPSVVSPNTKERGVRFSLLDEGAPVGEHVEMEGVEVDGEDKHLHPIHPHHHHHHHHHHPKPAEPAKPGIMRNNLRSRKRSMDEAHPQPATPSSELSTPKDKGGEKEGSVDSDEAGTSASKRARVDGNNKEVRAKPPSEKWRTTRMVEDLVNMVGEIMYPKITLGQYGYDITKGEVPLERPNTLGVLLCPARRSTCIENWSPREIAVFEGAITLHGKNFPEIAKLIRTKSCCEVIEFYYYWKMTSHYQQWKKGFEPLDPHFFSVPVDDQEEEEEEDDEEYEEEMPSEDDY